MLTILSQSHSLSARANVHNKGVTATGISLGINQLCAVNWQKEKNQGYDWYIAYVKSMDEGLKVPSL